MSYLFLQNANIPYMTSLQSTVLTEHVVASRYAHFLTHQYL